MEYWWCLEMEDERWCKTVYNVISCQMHCTVFIISFLIMLSYPCWLQLTVTISFLPRQLPRITSPLTQLSKLFQPSASHWPALILRVCYNSTSSVHACAHFMWHHGTRNKSSPVSQYAWVWGTSDHTMDTDSAAKGDHKKILKNKERRNKKI